MANPLMSKPQNTFHTTAAQQIRQEGMIPMVGTCSSCGRDRAVAFPGTAEHHYDKSGAWVHCPNPDCGQINWLQKLRG